MSVMDLSQLLGNLGAFIGSIAVLATLIYLADQVRQARRQLTVVGMQARANHARGVLEDIVNQIAAINELRLDPEIMSLVMNGDARPEDLSPVEKQQYFSYLSTILHAWQNMYVQMREGAYDEDSLSGWWCALRDNFELPGFVEFWNTRSFVMSPDFRQFVEAEVMRIPLNCE